jgi:hypothetical protein
MSEFLFQRAKPRLCSETLAAVTICFFHLNSRAAETSASIHPPLALERHLLISPGPGNPRNSEGDFIQLTNGHWLFIYTHFTGGAGDHASASLASRESVDGGRTWSGLDRVVVSNDAGMNVMSVSLLRLASGEIALFYLKKNSLQDCRPVMRTSRDEAKTWSPAKACVADQTNYFVLNNSRVVQLASGRLVMPLASHERRSGIALPGKITCYLSDDSGRLWRPSKSVLDRDTLGAEVNLMEPGVVETKTNSLLMIIRTKLGCQYMSKSEDGGETWAAPSPSALLSPESPATIRKLPGSERLLVIWNDQCDKPESYRMRRPPVRNPLVAAISDDGGRTWSHERTLEHEPGFGYCYTAVAFAGGRVLLGYCANASAYGLESTRISSFSLSELKN